MTQAHLCPECEDERPKPVQEYDLQYYMVCSCFDPTPEHSLDPPTSPKYSGSGKTKEDAIKDWNESIKENES